MYLLRTIHTPKLPSDTFPDTINNHRDYSEVIESLEKLEKDNLGKFIFRSEDTAIFQMKTNVIYKYVNLGDKE
ncbi:hypothetical protein FDI69_gp134 [Rhodococcus phage Trina]|uniref:Uncharacterized protein n=1 Tax=Rhodococcus phage Trina TaxID=2027905 RepID=A0A2D0ZN85_9CAUD|nr:hypothetical protein FDI69_gp134 [Rhodococcus phage Trina]ASZ75051.1 hypothetical protein SEA_TRINA_273 [Rhodococcus phage Trina]